MKSAQAELDRLTQNEKSRFKQRLAENSADRYNPQYFIKSTNSGYQFNGKYWEERDKGKWENAPKIFEDNCESIF